MIFLTAMVLITLFVTVAACAGHAGDTDSALPEDRKADTVDRCRNVAASTLLLTGTETKDYPSFATRALESTLPDARTAILNGQGHTANLTAPDLVAREVSEFLLGAIR